MFRSYNTVPRLTQQQFESKYKIVSIIDSGTYGNVVKYLDKSTNQFVAIKVLKDPDNLQTLQKQADLMKSIQHENVLNCLDYFYLINKSQFMLVMPYYSRNLKKSLEDLSLKDQKSKILVCLQIARGLNALHEKNIMHRDMKPANILVDQNWNIKICDFGFCKSDSGIGIDMSVKVGTPCYRDPNVIMGSYSKKCDIYSVGLIFDTIFRGQSYYQKVPQNFFRQEVLFFRDNKKKIIQKLICHDEMKIVILKCLQNSEIDRYNSKQLQIKLQKLWAKLNHQEYDQSFIEIVKMQKIEANKRIFDNRLKEDNQQQKQLEKMRQTVYKPIVEMRRTETYNLGSDYTSFDDIPVFSSQIVIFSTPKREKKNVIAKCSTSPSLKSLDSIKSISCLGFYEKLLSFNMRILDNLEKNSNFQDVYLFFTRNKQNIRKLSSIQGIVSIPNQDRKIVLFIGLFAYLRFLKAHRCFLNRQNQQKLEIASINGIKIENISKKTTELCLDLLSKQIIITLNAIKPFVNELNTDRILYRNKELSEDVLKMIDEGIMKKFSMIFSFKQEEINKEFRQIVLHKRYKSENERQEERKKMFSEVLNQMIGK